MTLLQFLTCAKQLSQHIGQIWYVHPQNCRYTPKCKLTLGNHFLNLFQKMVTSWANRQRSQTLYWALIARHIHRGIIKVPTVSTLCYTHLQAAWQTEGRDTAPPNCHALQEMLLTCPSTLADRAHKLVTTFSSYLMCEAMLSSYNYFFKHELFFSWRFIRPRDSQPYHGGKAAQYHCRTNYDQVHGPDDGTNGPNGPPHQNNSMGWTPWLIGIGFWWCQLCYCHTPAVTSTACLIKPPSVNPAIKDDTPQRELLHLQADTKDLQKAFDLHEAVTNIGVQCIIDSVEEQYVKELNEDYFSYVNQTIKSLLNFPRFSLSQTRNLETLKWKLFLNMLCQYQLHRGICRPQPRFGQTKQFGATATMAASTTPTPWNRLPPPVDNFRWWDNIFLQFPWSPTLDNLPEEHQRKFLAAAQHGETHMFLVPVLKPLLSHLDASSVKKADEQETLKISSFSL